MRLPLILLLLLAGCASAPKLEQPEKQWPVGDKWLVLAPDLAPYVEEWHDLFVAAGVDDPYLIVFHGVSWQQDWWYGVGRIEEARPVGHVAKLVGFVRKKLGPDRNLVVISCNSHGYILGMPNVYQADRVVWAKPGPDMRLTPTGWRCLAGDAGDFLVVR